MQHSFQYMFFLVTVFLLVFSFGLAGQDLSKDPATQNFIKQELNTGIKFLLNPERESLATDETLFSTKQTTGSAAFQVFSKNLLFLPWRQEQWDYQLEVGPYLGNGTLTDSSSIRAVEATTSPAGIRGSIKGTYISRFYFDSKNYTLISLNAWGQYDVYRRNAKGSLVDSNEVGHSYQDNSTRSKFRVGFQAKAGWGIGRMNPVNHLVAARHLLQKYYKGRNFSDEEISLVAQEIARIKHQRNLWAGHSTENETRQLIQFLNTALLLEPPSGIESDWELTEFRPRFQGSRWEMGPFFNYFNREPDFIYGGYLGYENQKYCNLNLNRSLGAGFRYNSYKKQDWISFEASAGWSWFPSLKQEIGVGVSYVPSMAINDLDDMGPIRHAVVPHLRYFSQLNANYRLDAAFAYRIAPKEEFILPGPELTISFYRSRY